MNLDFKTPLIPNFIRCKQGVFGIEELSEDELERYINAFSSGLRHRWETRRDVKQKDQDSEETEVKKE